MFKFWKKNKNEETEKPLEETSEEAVETSEEADESGAEEVLEEVQETIEELKKDGLSTYILVTHEPFISQAIYDKTGKYENISRGSIHIIEL